MRVGRAPANRFYADVGLGGYAASENHAALVPRGHRADQSKRVVLSCHGSGGTAQTWAWTDVNSYPINQWLARVGFPVLSCDFGGTNTWGNDTSRTRVGDAFTFAQSKLGVKTDKVLLFGASMGTLTALNYARANPTKVAAIALALPITDLVDAHDNRGFTAVTETAYGGTAAYNAAKAAHNPATNTADLAGIPIKLWYTTDDPYAWPATVAAFDSALGSADAVSIGTGGHSTAGLDPSAVADFFRLYS